MNNGQSVDEWAKAVAHLCFNNYKYSKDICLLLLKGIVNGDYSTVSTYLSVIKEIITIKEDGDGGENMLQRKRLEWIFGFAFLNFVQSEETVKFGLDSLCHNLKQDVYMMKSMLTYDPENDNSLLHLLWRYHGRMDVYTVNCLEHLGNFLVADESICEFFSNLPGLSY